MPRYYYDYTDPANHHRVRIHMALAETFPTGGLSDPPPWDYGFSYGSSWSPLPIYSVANLKLGEGSFNSKFPIGAPATPSASADFDLQQLSVLGFDEVVTALLNPVAAGGVSYAIPGGSSHTMTADTTNFLTVLSDKGNSALSIGSFPVIFQGAQVKQKQRPLDPSFEDDTCFYTATFAHAVEACLERIKPIDIAQYACYNLNTTQFVNPAGGSGDYAYAHLYDLIYQGSNPAKYAIGSATRASNLAEQFRCRLFAAQALSLAIETLAQEVYKSLIRDDAATFEFRNADISPSDPATPFDFLTFGKQNYGANGERSGDVPVNDGSGVFKAFFIGAGWKGSDLTYGVGDDSLGLALDETTNADLGLGVVFGMFSPHDTEAGVYSYDHAYDLFVDMCGGGAAKASYQFDSDRACAVSFSPILGGVRTTTNLQRSDVFSENDKPVLGAGYVQVVDVTIPDPQGEDEGSVGRAPTEGNLGDNKGGADLFFHNLPYLGSESDFKWWATGLPGQPNIVDTGNYVFLSYPYFSPRRLYYFDDAGGLLDGVSPILCHSQVQIEKNSGTLTAWIGTAQGWQSPLLRGSVSLPFSQSYQDYYTEQLIRGYRARVLALQRESCLAYAVSDLLQRMFGDPDQWGVSVVTVLDNADATFIGERFRFKDDSNNDMALDFFMPSAPYLDATSYPTLCYCTAAAEEDGFVKLALLAISAT